MSLIKCADCGTQKPLHQWQKPASAASYAERYAEERHSERVITGVVIAAEGFSPLRNSSDCRLEFTDDAIVLAALLPNTEYKQVAEISLRETRFLRVGGRGAVATTRGGGWFGGGIGAQGIIEGVVLASALNAITRRSSTTIETIVHLNAGARELMMLTNEVTPQVLQVRLAPLFVRIEELQAKEPTVASPVPSVSVADELRKLATLRDEGILSESEFDSAKTRLLGGA